MDPISYTGAELNIDGKTVTFPYSIADAVCVKDLVLVLLEIPTDEDHPNNIVAVTRDGQTQWEIDTPTEGSYDQPYHFIRTQNDKVYATNWDGYEYLIHLDSGAVDRYNKIDK